MDLEVIDTDTTQIDAWCRVENGAITESLVEEVVDGVRIKRPIRIADIERRGHPLDWYVRVTKVERATVPRYYRRNMVFRLALNSDGTTSILVKEQAKMPTIAYFLQRVRADGVKKYMDMDAYSRNMFRVLLTTSIDNSLTRFVKSRGYDSLAAAFGYIGSHIEKYDTEGKRARYLASETWAKYEWYLNALANDQLAFPVLADDILNHFPRLVWEEPAPVEEVPPTTTEPEVVPESGGAENVVVDTGTTETTGDPVTETTVDTESAPSEPVPPTTTTEG